MSRIDAIGDGALGNVLNRLPAVCFASAACVSRSWNRVCSSILSTPKLASALSLNPSIQDAVEEVCNKVFAEPIRPHFAIVAISQSFKMHDAIRLITKKLGSSIPIICTAAFGLMGRDVSTNGFKQIPQWDWGVEEEVDIFNNGYIYDPEVYADPMFCHRPKTPSSKAVSLTVGFLPGMKVAAVTLSESKKDVLFVDEFVTDIRECSAIASGCTSPAAIMLFTGLTTYTDRLFEKLDSVMSPETSIVGDGSSVFLCGGNCVQKNSKNSVAGVALLFMRDRDKPHGTGTIQFHVALSTAMSPVGPTYEAVSIREIRDKGTTWLTARREGFIENLDGQTIINQIVDEMPGRENYLFPSIGVVERRKCFLGSDEVKWITSQVFHQVHGGNETHLCVEGRGIKTGDLFRMFQSDSHLALSSLENVNDKFKSLKQGSSTGVGGSCLTPTTGDNNIIFGGIIFASIYREDRYFGKFGVDSTPFLKNFPGVPLAGLYCGNFEICRGDSSSYDQQSGGNETHLFVEGRGIKTGDLFRMFQSDSHLALSSLENVNDKFKSLKQGSSTGVVGSSCLTPTPGDNNIIFGGIIFACIGREDRYFGKFDVDSTPFLENFPGVPLAGLYCGNFEICRGDSSSYDQESGSYRCCAHSYSSVYFVMSYTPC